MSASRLPLLHFVRILLTSDLLPLTSSWSRDADPDVGAAEKRSESESEIANFAAGAFADARRAPSRAPVGVRPEYERSLPDSFASISSPAATAAGRASASPSASASSATAATASVPDMNAMSNAIGQKLLMGCVAARFRLCHVLVLVSPSPPLRFAASVCSSSLPLVSFLYVRLYHFAVLMPPSPPLRVAASVCSSSLPHVSLYPFHCLNPDHT